MLRIAKTENGMVRGIPSADPRVTLFKGIPFAAPPVGENRWRAPQPAKDWEGTLDAYTFKNISVQDTPGLGTDIYCREWHVDPEIPMGEDCLYLNIYSPAKSTEDKLPVLVWFFGGGFQWGYPSEMEFDGERLARRGIILVTVNYRLGLFGFLAHPELTKESPDAPTNFGSLDQQAGLHWVKRNIAAFGGDPDNITISGQSAGGASTMLQLTNADNKDCVNQAVILSGMIKNPFEVETFIVPQDISFAEKIGEEFFDFIGVKTLSEARKIDAFELRNKYGEFAKNHQRFSPCIDHKFCKDVPYDMIIRNEHIQVPIMSGCTGDEFHARVPEKYGKHVNEDFGAVEFSVKNCFNKLSKIPGAKPGYCYFFTPDIPGWDNPGTFHSVDLWFFFETLQKCWRPWAGRHYELARQMADYLTNFVKTGNPNGEGLPEWKPYTNMETNTMLFTKDGAVLDSKNTELIEELTNINW